MNNTSTTDSTFLKTLNTWLQNQSEILVLFRYSAAAGSKDFEFFLSFEALSNRIGELPPFTYVTAFKQKQLPLRGVVDDSFVATCLSAIPDGAEYLIVETVRRVYGKKSWFHHDAGVSHKQLCEDLGESRGIAVATGLYPPWLEDTDDVISAIVPDEHGIVRIGIY
jgi:hypothetical protein